MSLETFVQDNRYEAYNEGLSEGMAKGLAKGMAKGEAEGVIKATFNNLKTLMQCNKCSIDSAMDMLQTPVEERSIYKDLLAKGV